jgi:hypothetical protein
LSKDKILITGFPHTGTTIFKAKVGECNNVFEYPYECDFLRDIELVGKGDTEFTVTKSPSIPIEIKKYGLEFLPQSIYKDYHIIFITRNPWNLFTSVCKSGEDPIRNDTYHLNYKHVFRIEEYFSSCKLFLEASTGKYPNVYSIKYEDFFVDDYNSIKTILDDIGLIYDDSIFTKKSKDYVGFHNVTYKDINSNIDVNSINLETRPIIRTWQINQPFQNMNGDVDIPDDLSDILENSPIIKQLGYTDPRKIK